MGTAHAGGTKNPSLCVEVLIAVMGGVVSVGVEITPVAPLSPARQCLCWAPAARMSQPTTAALRL